MFCRYYNIIWYKQHNRPDSLPHLPINCIKLVLYGLSRQSGETIITLIIFTMTAYRFFRESAAFCFALLFNDPKNTQHASLSIYVNFTCFHTHEHPKPQIPYLPKGRAANPPTEEYAVSMGSHQRLALTDI